MSIPKNAAERGSAAAGPVVTMGTDVVPGPDRVGWWNDMVGQAIMPVTMSSPHAPRFEGRAQSVRLPHSMVADFTYSPMAARRSPVQIRRQDPEDYFLVLVADGSAIRLERRRADLADPGPRHSSIGEIATRWGFRHLADFSRAFRNACGIPPSEVRTDARDGGGA